MSSNLEYVQSQLSQDLQDLLTFCSQEFPDEPTMSDWQQSITQNMQMLTESIDELNQQQELVISLIKEAMLLSESGAQVEVEPSQKLGPPVKELNDYFAQDQSFAQAFQTLTPGRQRAYLIHFSQAKQSTTRQKRIERYKARILAGKGFHDCVCGHSQKMPRCDGSHKHFPNSQLL